jgi:ParB family chromosome partitioning protein
MATAEVIGESVFEIPLDQIIPSKNNPRKNIDEDSLTELAASINKDGVLSPILLRPLEGKNEIVCGERRFRACLLLERSTIPAFIRDLTDEQAEEAQIVENLQRADLDPLEEAEAFRRLMGEGTPADVAAKLGKEEAYVAKRLKLLQMIPDARKALQSGKIQLGHALEISRLSPEDQKRTLKFCQGDAQISTGDSWQEVKTTITVESLRKFIQGSLLVQLANANFDITDPTLNEEMGACTSCPHNTANQGALFGDIKAARCTLPECFFGKEATAIERTVEIVATETGSKKVFRLGIGSEHANRGMSKKKVDGYYQEHSPAIALVEKGKECESATPAVVAFVDLNVDTKVPIGKQLTVCVDEKCKVHHGSASKPGAKKPLKGLAKVEHKAEALAENLGQRVREEAFKQLADKLLAQAKFGGKKESFAALTVYVTAHLFNDRFRDMGKALGLEKSEKKDEFRGADWEGAVTKYFEKNPSAFILAMVASEGMSNDEKDNPLYRMAAEYKVDVKKIEKAITSEDKAELKAMRERAEAKTKPRKEAKPKKEKKAKAAKKAKKSEAELKAGK